jgi:hypothetical protein
MRRFLAGVAGLRVATEGWNGVAAALPFHPDAAGAKLVRDPLNISPQPRSGAVSDPDTYCTCECNMSVIV